MSPPKQILFKADCKSCRIGTTPGPNVDFTIFSVPAITSNDYSCKKISNCGKKGIEINPSNGHSFTLSIPPAGQPGPVPTGYPWNHIPFLAYAPVQNAPDSGELVMKWVASGEQLGVDKQPFGSAVKNPNIDFRLAYPTLPVLDLNTLCTLDWVITNEKIYILIERLEGGEQFFGEYAAYTYVIPVYKLKKDKESLKQIHEYETRYDKSKHTATFYLDKKPVLQVTQFGVRLTPENTFLFCKGKKTGLLNPKRFLIFDHGGNDSEVTPGSFQSGIGLFNLLDGMTANNVDAEPPTALLRVDTRLYRNPILGDTFLFNNPFFDAQTSFIIDGKLNTSVTPAVYDTGTIDSKYRLFGQGARLHLFKFVIYTM